MPERCLHRARFWASRAPNKGTIEWRQGGWVGRWGSASDRRLIKGCRMRADGRTVMSALSWPPNRGMFARNIGFPDLWMAPTVFLFPPSFCTFPAPLLLLLFSLLIHLFLICS